MNNIPENIQIEEGCLGCALLSKKALVKLMEETHEEDFYYEKCRVVYQYLYSCYKENIESDIIILTQKVNHKQVTFDWLTKLGQITSSYKIDLYIKELLELSQSRRLLKISSEIQDKVTNKKDVINIINEAGAELDIVASNRISSVTSLSEMATGNIDDLGSDRSVRRTGFKELDKILWGIGEGELIILAGHTSHGKSACVGNIATYIAKHYKDTVFWVTLEMYKQQMRRRFVSQEAQVDNLKIKMKRLEGDDKEKVYNAMNIIDKLPIDFLDKKNGMDDIIREAKILSHKKDLSLIVVDYLQLIQCFIPGATLAQIIGKIVNELKNLAEELGVPIIVLSQYSRKADKENYPDASWLKESSTIEQAADMIWFLHKYTEKQKEKEFSGDYLFDVGNLYRFIVDKNRDGKANFYINMEFIPEYTTFKEV